MSMLQRKPVSLGGALGIALLAWVVGFLCGSLLPPYVFHEAQPEFAYPARQEAAKFLAQRGLDWGRPHTIMMTPDRRDYWLFYTTPADEESSKGERIVVVSTESWQIVALTHSRRDNGVGVEVIDPDHPALEAPDANR